MCCSESMLLHLNYRVSVDFVEKDIAEWVDSSQISLGVTSTADCTCHHLTNSRKKLKFLYELRSCKQVWKFSNRKYCSTWLFKAFLVFEKRNVDTWLYVLLTGHITIWHIFKNIKLVGPNQKMCCSESMLLHLNYRVSVDFVEKDIAEWVDSSQISLGVTSTADCTCHHLTNSQNKLKFLGELRNSKQICEFSNRKYCSTWKFKAFLVLEKRNIDTWLYVLLTGHITIWHIFKNIKLGEANQKVCCSESML